MTGLLLRSYVFVPQSSFFKVLQTTGVPSTPSNIRRAFFPTTLAYGTKNTSLQWFSNVE